MHSRFFYFARIRRSKANAKPNLDLRGRRFRLPSLRITLGFRTCWMAARASGLGIDDVTSKSRQIEHRHVTLSAPAGEPKVWCSRFCLWHTYSFAVAKYGDVSAWHFALETARRLQHFYVLACRSSDLNHFCYSLSDLASVPECREWMVWVAGLETDSHCWVRAADVEIITPINPVWIKTKKTLPKGRHKKVACITPFSLLIWWIKSSKKK